MRNNRVARFRVMGNRTELESEIAGFERRLVDLSLACSASA